MGRQTYFYDNITGKSCKDLLTENYIPFRQWLQTKVCFGESGLAGFLHTDTGESEPYHAIIDELLPFFIDCFSDTGGRESYFFKTIPISVYSYHYEAGSGIILGTRDTAFIDLWDILLRGRSVVTGHWTFSIDRCVGYMTADEQKTLKEKIRIYFGNSDAIEIKYQSATVDYTGIACMDTVLDSIGDNHELLFTIDGF
ncbi:MAG: hypothetical protein LBN21_10035 [Treponema sp.]|jgi:hypothetical protein|nr:hypothetical protein [Treponema sp.]